MTERGDANGTGGSGYDLPGALATARRLGRTASVVDLDNGVPMDLYELFVTCTHVAYDRRQPGHELDILIIAREFEKAAGVDA